MDGTAEIDNNRAPHGRVDENNKTYKRSCKNNTRGDNKLATTFSAEFEKSTYGKVAWRLIPFLFLCYIVAFLDRVNVGFAALTMNRALGLSAEQFGLGGGLFFAGYVLFGIPSNLVLARLGARVWLPVIMVCWALASMLNAWATGPLSFYAIRFILGAGEAGLYPGLLFVLTEWLPGRYRVRMITLLVLSTPVSIMPYVAFSACPYAPKGSCQDDDSPANQSAPASGDLAPITFVSRETFRVTNNTCETFYLRVTAHAADFSGGAGNAVSDETAGAGGAAQQ